MADTVVVQTVRETAKELKLHLVGTSDGTGETNVRKVVLANFLAAGIGNAAAAVPVALDIERVRWAVTGHGYVKLSWDHAVDSVAMVLINSGYEDFTGQDGEFRDTPRSSGLQDPKTADSTGDLFLSIVTPVNLGAYDITITLAKRAA